MRESEVGWLRFRGLRVLVLQRHLALIRENIPDYLTKAPELKEAEEAYMVKCGYVFVYVIVDPVRITVEYEGLPPHGTSRERLYTLALKQSPHYDAPFLVRRWARAVMAKMSDEGQSTLRGAIEHAGFDTTGYGDIILNDVSHGLDEAGPSIRGQFEHGSDAALFTPSTLYMGNLANDRSLKMAMAVAAVPLRARKSIEELVACQPRTQRAIASQSMADAGGALGAALVSDCFQEQVRPHLELEAASSACARAPRAGREVVL